MGDGEDRARRSVHGTEDSGVLQMHGVCPVMLARVAY